MRYYERLIDVVLKRLRKDGNSESVSEEMIKLVTEDDSLTDSEKYDHLTYMWLVEGVKIEPKS